MTTDFVCPRADCGNTWTMEADEDGLFDGYGNPPCPVCGTNGSEANDYGDWECVQGHVWRTYGNGGLVMGTVPRCPECDGLPTNA
jgi:hypothetical protein